MSRLCMWACCWDDAVETDEQGYDHCARHWKAHQSEQLEHDRLCGRCGETYRAADTRRILCDDCRHRPKKQPAKCGTRAGRQAHRDRCEDPCEPCVVAEREYQREYKRERAAERRAA